MGLELKKGDQVIFLLDRSGSMDTQDCDNQSRYDYAKEKIKTFVRGASKFDPDGVSIHFFNYKVEQHKNVATPEQVDALIEAHRPGGGTRTDLAFEAAWREHKASGSAATFVICFTDGNPEGYEAEVENEIKNICNAMSNPEEFRISILTVGKRSKELAAWLEKIDSQLNAKYDIISHEELDSVDFDGAIADLIGSSTTAEEAAAGKTQGKTTTHV
jgi:Mg-chelatase subunit ChlD